MMVGVNIMRPVSGKQCASENTTVRCTMVVITSTSPPPKACAIKATPCCLPMLLPHTSYDNRPPDMPLSSDAPCMRLGTFAAASANYTRQLLGIRMSFSSIAAMAYAKSRYVMCTDP